MSAFDRVIGYEKEKEQLLQLCDIAKNPQKYAALGVRLPRGVLLHGEPGVGKTLMATAFVEETGRKRYFCRKDRPGDEFVNYIGSLFSEAKKNAPSVVLLDDLDKYISDHFMENSEELIAVQSGIDCVRDSDVFIIATANKINGFPETLLRPGRFDRVLEIGLPDRRQSVEIVRYYLSDKKVAADVKAEDVARLMDGYSCAALEAVLNEAGIYAGYERKTLIERDHLVRAVLRNIFSAEENTNKMSKEEKEEVAFHEAGHAAVALSYDPEIVGLISLRSCRGEMRGVVQILRNTSGIRTYAQMHKSVVSLLAGKAAVEIKYGRIDVGASSDIERASGIVEQMITKHVTSGFGLYCMEQMRGNGILSGEQNDKIVVERSAMIARCYEEAKELLRNHWAFVEKLAAELAERETLLYEEIQTLFKESESNR